MKSHITAFFIKANFPVTVAIGCLVAYAYVDFVKESTEKRIVFYKAIGSNSTEYLNKSNTLPHK